MEKVRFIVVDDAPSICESDAQGSLVGFEPDLVDALAAKLGVERHFSRADWYGAFPALHARKGDALIAFLDITDERKDAADFSDPYTREAPLGLVKRKDTDLGESSQHVIACQGGSTAYDYLEFESGALHRTDTPGEALDALVAGRVNAVVADKELLTAWLHSEKGRDFEFGQAITNVPASRKAIAVRRGDDRLRDRLNEALRQLQVEGTLDKLYDQYFSTPS
ncbi:transporter substrate-binding domain-containing protein [Streptomyces microflavus]|uniref:substrate-binding periplasmic protein n=1 Tax=Streptomyces microflavus TaxID=1919 RepID=UPI0033F24BE2